MRTSRGILRRVSAPTADALAEALRPLREEPSRARRLLRRGRHAGPDRRAGPRTRTCRRRCAVLLGRLARRYGCVACVSGRAAAEARRLVGVGGIAYAGSHGAELLEPGASTPRGGAGVQELGAARARASWTSATRRSCACCASGSRTRARSSAFHWRGVPDEDAATRAARGHRGRGGGRRPRHPLGPQGARDPAAGADRQGPRDPGPRDRGRDLRTALYGGDDATDLDAFEALEGLAGEGVLDLRGTGGRALRGGAGRDRGAGGRGGGRGGRLRRVLAALAAD